MQYYFSSRIQIHKLVFVFDLSRRILSHSYRLMSSATRIIFQRQDCSIFFFSSVMLLYSLHIPLILQHYSKVMKILKKTIK